MMNVLTTTSSSYDRFLPSWAPTTELLRATPHLPVCGLLKFPCSLHVIVVVQVPKARASGITTHLACRSVIQDATMFYFLIRSVCTSERNASGIHRLLQKVLLTGTRLHETSTQTMIDDAVVNDEIAIKKPTAVPELVCFSVRLRLCSTQVLPNCIDRTVGELPP